MSIILKLLELFEKYAPTFFAAYLMGAKQGAQEKMELKKKNLQLKLDLEKIKNKEKVTLQNAGKNSDDIIDAFFGSGSPKKPDA